VNYRQAGKKTTFTAEDAESAETKRIIKNGKNCGDRDFSQFIMQSFAIEAVGVLIQFHE
jgi:hypothetical protein